MTMEIMLLGTMHIAMDNKIDVVHLSDEDKTVYREQDFQQFVHLLASYEPDQIFVEIPAASQDGLDALYQRYIQEEHTLQYNETEQIAFRLAKRLQHEKLWAIDWNESLPHIPDIDDLSSDAGFQHIMKKANAHMRLFSTAMKEKSMFETFQLLNSEEQTKKDHDIYVNLMMLDDENAFEWVANYWYYRNLKMAKNIRSSIKETSTRVLVLAGAGHNYLLKQFLSEVPGYTVVNFGEVGLEKID
jgi:hypothetical protein